MRVRRRQKHRRGEGKFEGYEGDEGKSGVRRRDTSEGRQDEEKKVIIKGIGRRIGGRE